MKILISIFSFLIINICLCFAQWQSLDQGLEGPGGYTLFYDSSSSLLYVGGYYTNTGDGTNVHAIASWNGNNWDSLEGGIPGGFGVQAINKYHNQLYVSGCCFGYTNSNNSNYLGLWNGFSWDTLNDRINGGIEVMKEYNGELYLGGAFYRIGNVEHHLIAKLNGNNFSFFPFGLDAQGSRVLTIEFYQGDMYVGGNYYDTINGVNDLEVYDGVSLHPFGGNGLDFGGSHVTSMVVYNNELYIAGGFSYISGVDTFDNIMRWDGNQFHDVGGGINGGVNKMKVVNGEIYVCGYLNSAGNMPIHNYLAKWNGATWSEVFADTIDGVINDFLLVNSDLYLAGGFTHINNIPFSHIVKYENFVGIENVKNSNFIVSYSNPAYNFVFIEMADIFKVKYEIIDMLGKTIIEGNINSKKFEINVNGIPEGSYMLSIGNKDVSTIKKIILIK